jgi:hypothetical protein
LEFGNGGELIGGGVGFFEIFCLKLATTWGKKSDKKNDTGGDVYRRADSLRKTISKRPAWFTNEVFCCWSGKLRWSDSELFSVLFFIFLTDWLTAACCWPARPFASLLHTSTATAGGCTAYAAVGADMQNQFDRDSSTCKTQHLQFILCCWKAVYCLLVLKWEEYCRLLNIVGNGSLLRNKLHWIGPCAESVRAHLFWFWSSEAEDPKYVRMLLDCQTNFGKV